MDYDMNQCFILLSEVTNHFYDMPKPNDLRMPIPERNALTTLIHTNNKILRGDFIKRYLSQCMIGSGQPITNLLISISPAGTRYIVDIFTELTNYIPSGKRGEFHKLEGEQFKVPHKIFGAKTPFGIGHLSCRDTIATHAKNGKIIYEPKGFSSLVTVSPNLTNHRWELPTYKSIFRRLDNESIQNKELIARGIREFLETPIPEIPDGIGEVEKYRLIDPSY